MAFAGWNIVGKHLFGTFRLSQFFGGSNSARSVFLGSSPFFLSPLLLPLFFGVQRIRLVQFGGGRAGELFFQIGDALQGKLQLLLSGLQLALAMHDQIHQSIGINQPVTDILFEFLDVVQVGMVSGQN